MATTTITALSSIPAVASNDELAVWDVSAAQTKKILVEDLTGATLAGGGEIATGGHTLTIPATMTAAGRNVANTFTAAQTFSPTDPADTPLIINSPPLSTQFALRLQYAGVDGVTAIVWDDVTKLSCARRNLGNNVAGPNLFVGRNSNAGAEGPAAGTLTMETTSASRTLWIDASNNLRIHTAAPTGSSGTPTVSDTAGTVVGTQTSHIKFKEILGDAISGEEALQKIRAAVEQVKRFVYKSGAYGSQEFSGIILDGDELDRYGMDADAEHPAGKSLNVINLVGDLLLAVDYLASRVDALEAAA